MTILPLFDKKASKVGGFITVYELYLMRGLTVKEQIQWILIYVQRKLVNI